MFQPIICLFLHKRTEENDCGDQAILLFVRVQVMAEGTLFRAG